MSEPRFALVPLLSFLLMASPAAADPLSDLRAVLQRYPAKARFVASASLLVKGQSDDAGARAGSAKFRIKSDSDGFAVTTPPPALSAAASEARRKKQDPDSPTPTRNAMVALTVFDILDAVDVAAMLLNDLEGATLTSQTESSFAGRPAKLLRIKVKPDLAGIRSKLVSEPAIELRVWLNQAGVPVASERDATYSASVLFVKAANVRKEHWDIAVAGDRLYATRADQSNSASAAGKTLASSRSVTYEVTR